MPAAAVDLDDLTLCLDPTINPVVGNASLTFRLASMLNVFACKNYSINIEFIIKIKYLLLLPSRLNT